MDVLDLEGIDDDLELEAEVEVEAMETGTFVHEKGELKKDLDRPMSRLSVMPEAERPTSNELRLGKRVLDLERERDTLAVSYQTSCVSID